MEVVGDNGRRLVLSGRTGPEDHTQYVATLLGEFGEVRATVSDYQSGLAAFVRELADDWQGFDGVREYVSLESQFALHCTHDGLGVVNCEVTLRQPGPPEWSTSAIVTLGAGAHLSLIADEIEVFFAGAS